MLFDGYTITVTGGVDKASVELAENALGFKLSSDFVEYLLNYGTVELNGNELFGLGVEDYRNIIIATTDERSLSQNFPENYCVIFNLGINSVLILLGNDGCIYQYSPQGIEKIFDSFNNWILEEYVNYPR